MNGVIKQIWPLFNFVQVIVVFQKMIDMPANVAAIFNALDGIVNFKLVPKEVVDKILGTGDDQ